jgi:fermentation-respiration switch protein FrsA (DUF1100 family)
MIRVARLLALIMAFLGIVWITQRWLIYFPTADLPAPGAVGLPTASEVAFPTADGLTLRAWFVPAAGTDRRITVLFFSGNGGNRALRAPFAAALAVRGISTLLVDYRGYGGNPGRPTESGLAADARAARAYLAQRPGADATRVVYFGESLGTGVAVRLATEHPPFALVLRSPYTSLVDIGRRHYPFLPVSLLLADRFASIDRIGGLSCPVLVIAGTRDSIVPADQSERLFEAARNPSKKLLMIDGADHNDYELLAGAELIDTTVAFIDGLAASR